MARGVQCPSMAMGGHDVTKRARSNVIDQPLSHRRSERGVTLPEVLVVLAIIGLFVVVTVPALGNYIRLREYVSPTNPIEDSAGGRAHRDTITRPTR